MKKIEIEQAKARRHCHVCSKQIIKGEHCLIFQQDIYKANVCQRCVAAFHITLESKRGKQ